MYAIRKKAFDLDLACFSPSGLLPEPSKLLLWRQRYVSRVSGLGLLISGTVPQSYIHVGISLKMHVALADDLMEMG